VDIQAWNRLDQKFRPLEELGALSVFLASDAAASITGTPPPGGRWLDRALSGRGRPVVPPPGGLAAIKNQGGDNG